MQVTGAIAYGAISSTTNSTDHPAPPMNVLVHGQTPKKKINQHLFLKNIPSPQWILYQLSFHALMKPFIVRKWSGKKTEPCSIENGLAWPKHITINIIYYLVEINTKVISIGPSIQ